MIGKGKKLQPRFPKKVAIKFLPSYEGRYEDTVEFVFSDAKRKEQFVITRRIAAIVGSEEDHKRLQPKEPYVRPSAKEYERPRRVVPGERPPTWAHTKWAVKLPLFPAPQNLIDAAFGPRPSANVKPFIPEPLNLKNYAKRWQALIWIEEEKMEWVDFFFQMFSGSLALY